MTADTTPSDGDVRQARDSGGARIDPGLARDMSELARELHNEADPQRLLDRIVFAAMREIPAAVSAGITISEHGELATVAATDQLARDIDRIQYETRQGPCVQAAIDELTVRADDLSSDRRWPEFASRCVERGVHSMLAVQLFVEQHSYGALNLYARTAHAFVRNDENIALVFAAHAAVAIAALRKQENLQIALETRDLIGQAKGVLIERYKIDGQAAFELLVLASQNGNVKLRRVAEHLVQTGEVPLPGQRR